MTSVLIVGLVGGFLATVGLVAFLKGAFGKKHVEASGKSYSPIVNIVLGWLSAGVAVLLWHLTPMRQHPRAAFLAVAVGVLVAGIYASLRSKKHA